MSLLLVGQVLVQQLVLGTCYPEGDVQSCYLSGCDYAEHECSFGYWTPCQCQDAGNLPLRTGVVTGVVQFYQNQGNYCPATRDCTGARYLQAEFNTFQPLRDTKVYVVDASSGATLGQAVTDSTGTYIVSWSKETEDTSVQALLRWRGQHKDGRFNVTNADGSVYSSSSASITINAGTTAQAPQVLGTPFRLGQVGAPNAYANIYDGAWRAWDVLRNSNRMVNGFTGFSIRAMSSQCSSSCFYTTKTIYLNSGAEWQPQARVMHEIGHGASWLSDGHTNCLRYCHPNATGEGCGWNQTSPEWSCAGFEEGLATFFGDTALYGQAAVAPFTCLSSGVCTSDDVETSASCVSGQERWPLTVDRYLWDIYDSHTDYLNEATDRALFEFMDNLAAFAAGTGEGKKDEPWNSTYSTVDDLDGRSAVDFRDVWSPRGVNTSTQYSNNCSPTGD